jgi:putative chitinase
MKRTLDILVAAMPRCKDPIRWVVAFENAFGDRPPQDLAMLFAQLGHESADLNRLEESLSYSSVERIREVFGRTVRGWGDAELRKLVRNPEGLANAVYAFKGGNGNTLSGDGWRFRGRGPIQISLRDNYTQLQADTELPVLSDPDILIRDRNAAALSALWYWRKNVADGGSVGQVTRQINGPAMDGLIARKARYEAALRVGTQDQDGGKGWT